MSASFWSPKDTLKNLKVRYLTAQSNLRIPAVCPEALLQKNLQMVVTLKLELFFLILKQILRNIRSCIFRIIAVVLK